MGSFIRRPKPPAASGRYHYRSDWTAGEQSAPPVTRGMALGDQVHSRNDSGQMGLLLSCRGSKRSAAFSAVTIIPKSSRGYSSAAARHRLRSKHCQVRTLLFYLHRPSPPPSQSDKSFLNRGYPCTSQTKTKTRPPGGL